MNKIHMRNILIISPVIIFSIHLVLWFLGLYSVIPFLDIPLHFSGGVVIGLFTYGVNAYLPIKNKILNHTSFHDLVMILGVVSFAAIGWEYFEFCLDKLTGSNFQNSLSDTLKDLGIGQIGGIASFLFLKHMKL